MHNRFKEVRIAKGKSQIELGKMMGVSRDTIANIEGDRLKITPLHISALCRAFPDIDEHWLRTGEGEMLRKLTEDEELEEWIGRIQFDSINGDRVAAMKKKLLIALKRIKHDETWEDLFQVINEVANGNTEE